MEPTIALAPFSIISKGTHKNVNGEKILTYFASEVFDREHLILSFEDTMKELTRTQGEIETNGLPYI